MKALVLICGIFAASFAQAKVMKHGEFVPELCSSRKMGGVKPSIVDVTQVCTGTLTGMNTRAVEIKLNSGEKRVYKVKFKLVSGNGGMGITKSSLAGHELDRSDKIEGELVTTSGVSVTHQISIRTDSNLAFAGYMESVKVLKKLRK